MKRKDVQQQIARGHQLQAEEGLGDTLQQDLQNLETTLSKMDHTMDSQEQELEVTSLSPECTVWGYWKSSCTVFQSLRVSFLDTD